MQQFNSIFTSMFPNFAARCVELQSLLLPVAYVLLVVGLMSATIGSHRSPSAYLRTFGRTGIYVVLLVFLVSWGNQIAILVDNVVREVLKADPSQVYQNYNELLAPKKGDQSWFDKLWNLDTTIFEALVSGILFLFSWLAGNLVFWAYLAQTIIVFFAYALSPVFIGFLAIPTLNPIGRKFFLNLVGVLLWPLGWGLAAIVTQGMLDFMTDQSFLTAPWVGRISYGLQNLLGLAVLGVWLVFSTIAAPVILQKALAEGYLAGSLLLSGGAAAGKGAASAGLTAGAAVASRGGSGGLAALAGAATGIESLIGSGGLGGSAVGSLATMREYHTNRNGHAKPVSFPADDPTGAKTAQTIVRRQRARES